VGQVAHGHRLGLGVIKAKPLWVDAVAWYPYTEAMHQQMMRTSRYDEQVDMAIFAFDGTQQLIGIPREMCHFPWRGTLLDRRTIGKPITVSKKCLFPPRNNEQARVMDETGALLLTGSSHIVEASTGFGKTYCACNNIARTARTTLIVVTKEDLMQSWPKELNKFFGIPPERIGVIQQDKCEVEGKDVVMAMVHSLAQRDDYPEFIKRYFGLIVFDEVHHMAAESFSKVAAMFHAELRLGYSATVNRPDGKDWVFHGHIGRPLVQAKLLPMPPKVLIQYSNWKVPKVKRFNGGRWASSQLFHEFGKLGKVLPAMAMDQDRNKMIVSIAVQAYQKKRWVVVMSELAEDKHLGMLRRMCQDAGVPDTDMAYYKGGMTEKAREQAKTKHLVFATYGMTAEATDVPWWDCLILATPRANIMQAAGRVCRDFPDKPKPVIVDIADTDSEVLNGYFKARLKQYNSDEMKGEVIFLT